MSPLWLPVLAFAAIVALGAAVLVGRTLRYAPVQRRLFEEQQAEITDWQNPRLLRFVGRVGEMAVSEPSPGLRASLAAAGFHGTSAPVIYMGSKLLLLAAGLSTGALLLLPRETPAFSIRVLLTLLLSGILFMLPNLVVLAQRQRRREQVQHHWPDALDLLEICVSSGMGLDQAWNCVADEIRGVSPTLADEMALTDFEIHLNAPRATAMRHMAKRTGVEDISSMVGILVQSERFGSSIADALRTFASSMREIRTHRAEEAAEKMAVKLLFPMILLIFPALLIVIVGPAGLRWAEWLRG